MASIDQPSLAPERLRPYSADDLLPLSVEAGWNQVADDWRFMLSRGNGVGIRHADRWIACALVLPLGAAYARNRGVELSHGEIVAFEGAIEKKPGPSRVFEVPFQHFFGEAEEECVLVLKVLENNFDFVFCLDVDRQVVLGPHVG